MDLHPAKRMLQEIRTGHGRGGISKQSSRKLRGEGSEVKCCTTVSGGFAEENLQVSAPQMFGRRHSVFPPAPFVLDLPAPTGLEL